MTTPTPKPCPVCLHSEPLFDEDQGSMVAVVCTNCHFAVWDATKAEAVESWNAIPRQEDIDARDATIARLSAALTRSRRLIALLREQLLESLT